MLGVKIKIIERWLTAIIVRIYCHVASSALARRCVRQRRSPARLGKVRKRIAVCATSTAPLRELTW